MTSGKILVVDDDLAVRNLVQRFLTKLNYEVEAAADGKTAQVLFESFKPYLVILDITLPDLDSYELCDEMHRNSDVFVLMLTRNLEPLGNADGYLNKPFSLGELSAKVAAIFNRGDDNDQWGYTYVGRL
ncbi:response regulator [Tolypothrix sp. LEGE 11397]|nr:response regulator [Tolypothrix sp. PCC 7601]MBE9083711.1 response regulator [Tolypothrix sp. LEGE 11397]UYD23725.1 response regulator [Tolypothrix sp. PCC 7712]UYD34051.1 response regulator [Tolypothrix sp. PCC 7601]BAY89437.1 two component transcriptional regulator [Microchaete diplosiphon NIES-3275]